MWQTNQDMVRGLSRFVLIAAWVVVGLSMAAVALGVLTTFITKPPWTGPLMVVVGIGLLLWALARLQKAKQLRGKVAAQDHAGAAHAQAADDA